MIPRTLHPTFLGAAPETRRRLAVVPLIRDQRYYGESPMRLRRDSGAARGTVRCRIGAIGGERLDGSGCQARLGWVAGDAADGPRAMGSLKA